MMKKKAMKLWGLMLTVVLALSGCVGALAEEVVVLTSEPAPALVEAVETPADPGQAAAEEVVVAQQEQWYRVTFYDLNGEELFYVEVTEGGYVELPEFFPYVNGLLFQFWFDEMGQLVPYEFGTAVSGNMNLVPYYLIDDTFVGDWTQTETVLVENGQTAPTMTEEQATSLVESIINATPSVDVAPAPIMTDEAANQLILDIVGSADVPATQPSIPAVMTEEGVAGLINDIIGTEVPSVVAPPSVMADDSINSLINEIIASADEAVISQEPKITEPSAMSDDAAQDILDDVLLPVDAPVLTEDVVTDLIGEILAETPADDSIVPAVDEVAQDDLLSDLIEGDPAAEAVVPETELPSGDVQDDLVDETLAEDDEEIVVEEPVASGDDALIDQLLGEMMGSFGGDTAPSKEETPVSPEDAANALLQEMLDEMNQAPASEETEEPVEEDTDEEAPIVEMVDEEESVEEEPVVEAPEETEEAADDEDAADEDGTEEEVVVIDDTEEEAAGEPEEGAEEEVIVDEISDEAQDEAGTEETAEEPAEEDAVEEELVTIEDDEVPLAGAMPYVEVEYLYDGVLTVGTEVTVVARLYNVPDGYDLQFNWSNNASGEFVQVAGATSQSYTFTADASNTDCVWTVDVTIGE